MIDFATYDWLPCDDFFPQLFNLTETDPFNDHYENQGFETKSFYLNLGSLFVVYLFMLLMIFFICVHCKNNKWCSKAANYFMKDLFWSHIIDFFIQAYLEIVFAIVLSLSEMIWDTWGDTWQNWTMYLFIVYVVSLPIWMFFFLYNNYEDLDSPEH
jgi:hypothetical protein